MIGRIQGILLEKNPPQILVDVHGIGYEIDVPMSTFYNLPEIGQPVTLLTHFVVREDAQLLYGFGTAKERAVFRQLNKISGIGARTALAVLSGMSVDALAQAVAQQECALLTRVPGIGKKTAERLVLELKGKITAEIDGVALTSAAGDNRADVAAALIALGYSEREANAAAKKLAPDISVSAGIREALKSMAR